MTEVMSPCSANPQQQQEQKKHHQQKQQQQQLNEVYIETFSIMSIIQLVKT